MTNFFANFDLTKALKRCIVTSLQNHLGQNNMHSKNINNDWQDFITLCQKAGKQGLLGQLFDFLFTPEEREQLPTRIKLTEALLNGELSQRAISAELGISISKITRGSNALKAIDDDLRKFLESN